MKRKELQPVNVIENISLGVCILFYERLEQTLECIQSFLPSKANIYILNNGSSCSARKELGQFCKNYKQIKIFDSDNNLGVGVGRNYLTTHTTEEWLLFVDNDITVKTRDWLKKFKKHLTQNEDIEVFIPKLYNVRAKYYTPHTSLRIESNKAILNTEISGDFTNCFPGGASFVNRKLFGRLGLYDDKMFSGLEDYELCIRGILLGKPIKARIIKDIKIIHDHRQVKKKEDRNAISVRYDVNYIQKSFNRIIEKHNIFLKGDWTFWCFRASERILKGSNKTNKIITTRLKRLIPDSVKKLIKRVLLKIRAVPTTCRLFMTERCDFKYLVGCRANIRGVNNPKEMRLSPVKKLVSLYPYINSFIITGFGEPTLCNEFVDVVNFLGKKGKTLTIITNGTNLEKLLSLTYKPDYISISLYGYDKESYLRYTGVDAYSTVVNNFLKLKNRFNNVGFLYVLTKNNFKDLKNLLYLCDKLNPDFLHLNNYLACDPNDVEEVKRIITNKDTEIITNIEEHCRNRDYVKIKPVYVDFKKPEFFCTSYDYTINLDGDGNIGGCLMQIPPNPSFGNIFKDNDPYNSLEMSKLRKLQHSMVKTKKTPHIECHYCFGNWYSD